MARHVTHAQLCTLSLRDRAASIRWAAGRVTNEYLAEELRRFADQLDAKADEAEQHRYNSPPDLVTYYTLGRAQIPDDPTGTRVRRHLGVESQRQSSYPTIALGHARPPWLVPANNLLPWCARATHSHLVSKAVAHIHSAQGRPHHVETPQKQILLWAHPELLMKAQGEKRGDWKYPITIVTTGHR